MRTYTSTYAGQHIGELFALASRGEQILITSHRRPYVTMGPPPADLPVEAPVDEAPAKPKPKKRPARKRTPAST